MGNLLVEQRRRLTEIKFAFPNEIEAAVAAVMKREDNPYKTVGDVIFIRKFFIEDLDTKAQEGLGPGQILHTISTIDADRIGDVMMPHGADLRDYKQNPIILWSHDYRDPDNIIGKNLWIKPDDKGITTLSELDIDSEKAAKIFRLYQKGILKAWSVGFIPIEWKRVKSEIEEGAKPGTIVIDLNGPKPGQPRIQHTKWLLLEYSAVAVPMNPKVSTERVAKEFELSNAEIKEFGLGVEEAVDKTHVSDRVILDMAGGAEGEEQVEKSGASTSQTPAAERGAKADSAVDVDGEALKSEYAGAEPTDAEYVEKPYPSEHACRLADPSKFETGSFRSTERKHEGKTYRVIMGKLKGKSTMTEQAYRYPKEDWKVAEARTHCTSHNGISFEPAKGSKTLHEEVSEMRETMTRLEKVLAEEKAGRVLSEKNRTLVQSAVDKLKASSNAVSEATAALEDLLSATEGKAITEEERIVLELGNGIEEKDAKPADSEVVLDLDGEIVTAKEVAEEFDVADLVALVEKKPD